MLEILALGKELPICIKKQIHLLSQHTPASVCFPRLPLAHIQGAQIRSFTTNLRNKDAFLKHYKACRLNLQSFTVRNILMGLILNKMHRLALSWQPVHPRYWGEYHYSQSTLFVTGYATFHTKWADFLLSNSFEHQLLLRGNQKTPMSHKGYFRYLSHGLPRASLVFTNTHCEKRCTNSLKTKAHSIKKTCFNAKI